MTRIETVVLDMAGTTVVDDGLVLAAFERAWDGTYDTGDEARRADAVAHVIATMGQSKIEVFRALADEEDAQRLNTAFEAAFAEVAASVVPVPGAQEAVRELKAQGRSVVFITGFSRLTVDAILGALGWEDLADAVITPADAGRGRPAPDMVLLAALRTAVSSMDAVAVVGDTPSDAGSALNAGAGLVVGVLTGHHSGETELHEAGVHHVLGSVTELPSLLAHLGR